jgi:hypothetical protein
MTTKNKYPECEKLLVISEKSQELGYFLEWLTNRYTLCQSRESVKEYIPETDETFYTPEGYYPIRLPIQAILADYFNIDMNKVEEEKNQILKELRSKHE